MAGGTQQQPTSLLNQPKGIIMLEDLGFSKYTSRPLEVYAVRVTSENIKQLAELVGGEIYREEKNDRPFIKLDKKIVKNVDRAYITNWLVRLDDGSYRVHRERIFWLLYQDTNNIIEGE